MFSGKRHPAMRRRVLLLFVLTILLPAILLSYFAIQSIYREQKWQENLRRENMDQALLITRNTMESRLADRVALLFDSLEVTIDERSASTCPASLSRLITIPWYVR